MLACCGCACWKLEVHVHVYVLVLCVLCCHMLLCSHPHAALPLACCLNASAMLHGGIPPLAMVRRLCCSPLALPCHPASPSSFCLALVMSTFLYDSLGADGCSLLCSGVVVLCCCGWPIRALLVLGAYGVHLYLVSLSHQL